MQISNDHRAVDAHGMYARDHYQQIVHLVILFFYLFNFITFFNIPLWMMMLIVKITWHYSNGHLHNEMCFKQTQQLNDETNQANSNLTTVHIVYIN